MAMQESGSLAASVDRRPIYTSSGTFVGNDKGLESRRDLTVQAAKKAKGPERAGPYLPQSG
jgi:hypothetical protein